MNQKRSIIIIFLITALFLSIATEFIQPINAASDTGSLSVHCNKDGGSIYMDSNLNGTTDAWGNCNINNIQSGTHSIKVTKVGYKDWTKQVTIDTGKTTNIYLYLESGAGNAVVRIETIPSGTVSGTLKIQSIEGVNIYANDEFGGTTDPWGSAQVNGLLKGTYTVELSLLGYKNWIKTINIEPGLTTTVYANPEPGTGDATIRSETIAYNSTYGTLKVHSSSNVKVYINDEYGGTTDTWGIIDVNGLMDGTYNVTLTQIGCKDWSKQVKITAGQKTEIYPALETGAGKANTRNETISYDSPTGTLTVKGIDGTFVYVGDEYGGTIDWGKCQVNGLIVGSNDIKLKTEGYKDWTKTIIITAGQITTVTALQIPEPTIKDDLPTIPPTKPPTTPPPTGNPYDNPNMVNPPTSQNPDSTSAGNGQDYLNLAIIGAVISVIAITIISIITLATRTKKRQMRKPSTNLTAASLSPNTPEKASFCQNCGSAVTSREEFCLNCGKKIA